MKINILRSAQNDLENGFLFYEELEAGIGDYFLSSLSSDILSLRLFAGKHQIIRGYFRKVASKFPYSIYYQVEDSDINIHAVIDNRRNPEWIGFRLGE